MGSGRLLDMRYRHLLGVRRVRPSIVTVPVEEEMNLRRERLVQVNPYSLLAHQAQEAEFARVWRAVGIADHLDCSGHAPPSHNPRGLAKRRWTDFTSGACHISRRPSGGLDAVVVGSRVRPEKSPQHFPGGDAGRHGALIAADVAGDEGAVVTAPDGQVHCARLQSFPGDRGLLSVSVAHPADALSQRRDPTHITRVMPGSSGCRTSDSGG